MTKCLDLGCGREAKNPFGADEVFGIDVRDDVQRQIKRADLVVEPIPFANQTFDYVTAFDFIEHIPRLLYRPHRTTPFVDLMNEVYRVLIPSDFGGLFYSKTPAFPYADAWRDPTHVNIITEETFGLYFDNKNRWASMYGFTGAFDIVRQGWEGHHLITVMKKVPEHQILETNLYSP
jgi:hypothetical protein